MLRTICAGCGSRDLDVFLDLGTSPLADRFPATADEPQERFPLRVATCARCKLAQLLDVVDDSELYGADYGFLTGTSPSSLDYFRSLAGDLLNERDLMGRLVVEIACNDGTFLKHFRRAGSRVLGIEPAKPAADAARFLGIDVRRELFTADVGASVGPRAALVLAFNVAAHVPDPLDFLEGIRRMLAPDGVAVVEFQYLGDLIAGCQFDHVYHEHRFFYSLSSFGELAAKAGLAVLSRVRTPAQGGSLRVTLSHAPAGYTPPDSDDWLSGDTQAGSMQGRAEYARDRLLAILEDERREGRTVAGYGATAKSATLLNFCGIGPDLVPWIEDLTPAKQGRYSPGTGIPIVPPGMQPDTYLLLAWNYLPGVIRRERKFLDTGGRFVVPGAVPVVI